MVIKTEELKRLYRKGLRKYFDSLPEEDSEELNESLELNESFMSREWKQSNKPAGVSFVIQYRVKEVEK